MTRKINKASRLAIDKLMMLDPDCTSISGTPGGAYSTSIFEHGDDMKIIIGYLQANGYDVFKRGTKEPERISSFLEGKKWTEIKDHAPAKNIRTFGDMF